MRGLLGARGARLAALAVVALGALLLILGVARATVWAPPAHTVVHVAGRQGAPVVDTTPGALALDGPSVRLTVRAADPSQTVFLGVGRASDVEAYLGNVARTEITGARGSDAVLASTGSDSALPEPAGVDVWALAVTGRGTATLTWPRADGSWRAVAAVDGATPPAEVVVDWQRARGSALTPTLIALGGVLLVLGAIGVRATRSGARSRHGAVREAVPDGVPVASRRRAGARRAMVPRIQDVEAPADDEDDEDDEEEVEETPAPFRQDGRADVPRDVRGDVRLDVRQQIERDAGQERPS